MTAAVRLSLDAWTLHPRLSIATSTRLSFRKAHHKGYGLAEQHFETKRLQTTQKNSAFYGHLLFCLNFFVLFPHRLPL